MSNTVSVTKTLEGRKTVFHVYLASDGAEGDLEDYVLCDPVDLGLDSSARLSVEHIIYSLSGFEAKIEFDTGLIEDKMIWLITGQDTVDFRPIGGLKDRSSALDGTGKLLLNTSGFSEVDDQGSLIITVKV
jgi:hypothetical protein